MKGENNKGCPNFDGTAEKSFYSINIDCADGHAFNDDVERGRDKDCNEVLDQDLKIRERIQGNLFYFASY